MVAVVAEARGLSSGSCYSTAEDQVTRSVLDQTEGHTTITDCNIYADVDVSYILNQEETS